MDSLQKQFRKQYGKHGIYAGSSHFRDYWSRDALFSCFGALALKDYTVVRRTLELFLNNLGADGHVALRIGAKSQVLNYLGLPTRTGVHHNQDKGSNPSYDGNSLLLILAAQYEAKTKQRLDRIKLRAVLDWNLTHERNGLLPEGPYSSWEDSIKLSGPRLYTNICYYRSLRAAATLFADNAYNERATKTKARIQKWWHKQYFSDGPHNRACLVAGNILAVLWGVTTQQQARTLLAHIANRSTVCPPAGFWKPRMHEAYIPFFFIHLQDYHGYMEWSWLAAIEIAAYRAIGDHKQALQRTRAVEQLITQYGGLHEVYEHDVPVARLIYRSEKHFSWATGLFIASQPSTWSCLQ